VTSDPVLLSNEDLRWWIDDGYHPDAIDPADELLLAREVLTLLAKDIITDYGGTPGWGFWHEGCYEPLGDIRPDLARYLAALEALPQEDSR